MSSQEASIHSVVNSGNSNNNQRIKKSSFGVTAIVALLGIALIASGICFSGSMSSFGSHALITVGSILLLFFAYRVICHIRASKNNQSSETPPRSSTGSTPSMSAATPASIIPATPATAAGSSTGSASTTDMTSSTSAATTAPTTPATFTKAVDSSTAAASTTDMTSSTSAVTVASTIPATPAMAASSSTGTASTTGIIPSTSTTVGAQVTASTPTMPIKEKPVQQAGEERGAFLVRCYKNRYWQEKYISNEDTRKNICLNKFKEHIESSSLASTSSTVAAFTSRAATSLTMSAIGDSVTGTTTASMPSTSTVTASTSTIAPATTTKASMTQSSAPNVPSKLVTAMATSPAIAGPTLTLVPMSTPAVVAASKEATTSISAESAVKSGLIGKTSSEKAALTPAHLSAFALVVLAQSIKAETTEKKPLHPINPWAGIKPKATSSSLMTEVPLSGSVSSPLLAPVVAVSSTATLSSPSKEKASTVPLSSSTSTSGRASN